jgi:hypothetical protein
MSFVNTACPATPQGQGYSSLTVGPGSPLSAFSVTSDWYNRFAHGLLGYEKWTNDNGSTAVSKATWTFSGLSNTTTYTVCAFIPDNYANNTSAHYQGFVGSASSYTFDSHINQAAHYGWVFLGTLPGSGTPLRVVLDDTGPTQDSAGNPEYTAADAMKLTTGTC